MKPTILRLFVLIKTVYQKPKDRENVSGSFAPVIDVGLTTVVLHTC